MENKLWYIYAIVYYTVIQINELLSYVKIENAFQSTLLNKIDHYIKIYVDISINKICKNTEKLTVAHKHYKVINGFSQKIDNSDTTTCRY